MTRSRLATLITSLALAFCATPTLAEQVPINSQAELTRYLQNTPAGSSPLDALSFGARKRFLTQVQFGERGLRGLSLDDPRNELTHPQLVRLLSLFGAEKFAGNAGLTIAEQARRQHERAEDAAAKTCAVATCAESDIEQRYDEFVLYEPDASLSDAKRTTLMGQRYDQLFSSYLTADALRAVDHTDLRLLERAIQDVVLNLSSTAHIPQWQMTLAEMQRRGMLEDKDYAPLHQALIASRDFKTATALAEQHPDMGDDTSPTLLASLPLRPGQPTALTLDAAKRTMQRTPFDLSAPLQIVVVASCHFSQDAARAIKADAQLRPIFVDHAIWLADQRESFSSVTDWNHEFPQQPIHIAWQNSEWSQLDSWTMPTFYVFRHGQLVKQFSGWLGLVSLKQSLREADVLR